MLDLMEAGAGVLGNSIWEPSRRIVRLAVLTTVVLWFALSTASWAEVTGDPSEFDLCPTSFLAPAGGTLLCSHSETTGGQLTIGSTTATISNNPDTVDFGAYSSSGLGLLGVEVIVTPTNGRVFGGPAQVVPGGFAGANGNAGAALQAA